MSSIDRCFISRLVESGDVKVFVETKSVIKPNMVKEPEKSVYVFCSTYFEKYRKIPSFALVEESFRESFKTECDAELKFYVDEIINREAYNQISVKINDIYPLMDRGRGLEALEKLDLGIREVYKSLSSPDDVKTIFSYGDEVLSMYEKAKKGMVGISTPWPTLNELTLGWQPEDLALFIARPSIGKCVSYDSVVQCMDGKRITIKEFCANRERFIPSYDEVSHKIVYKKVLNWIYSGVKKCYRVVTRTGRYVDVTSCHPFFDYNRKWRSIDDGLCVGDKIAVPRELKVFGCKKEDDLTGMEYFEKLSTDEVLFDEIVSISEVGAKEVFDLEIEGTHNFVANDMVVHNTWLLIMLARHAWEVDKKKVLVVSPEISNARVLFRFLANRLKADYEQMRKGRLGEMMEEKLKKEIAELMAIDDGTFKIVGRDFGSDLMAVEKAVIIAEPDIVFVDGAYLLERKRSWDTEKHERVSNVIDELKGQAKKYHVPYVATSQLNRKASGKHDVRDDMIAFSDAVFMDADYLFAMVQDIDMRSDRIMNIQSMKVREGDIAKKMVLRWDFVNADFSEIPSSGGIEGEIPF